MSRHALVLLVVVSAGCGGARPAPAIDPILDGQTVDVSVVILRGDDVAVARDAERVIPLASLSKQLWATAIAQLSEQGTLDVDAPVADVLPAFPDARVTVRHLMTHTSGLGDDADGEDDEAFTDLPPPAFEPGSWWTYSNRASLVARRVIEAASGQTWPEYLAAHIAGPLELRSMRTCTADDAPDMPATTIDRIEFVCANALDVARFERALDRGRLVSAETLAAMRAPTQIAGAEVPYGWFTRIGDVDGHRGFGHTGNFPGVSVAAYTFPDDDLTIAVLTRGSSPPAWALLTQIARTTLDLPPPTLPTDDAARPPPALAALAAGTYEAAGMVIRITDRDGTLHGQIVEPAELAWEGDLVWLGDTHFAGSPEGVDPDARLTFLVVDDHAIGFMLGHRLLLDIVFRRVD